MYDSSLFIIQANRLSGGLYRDIDTWGRLLTSFDETNGIESLVPVSGDPVHFQSTFERVRRIKNTSESPPKLTTPEPG
jgi:hypothetical protein